MTRHGFLATDFGCIYINNPGSEEKIGVTRMTRHGFLATDFGCIYRYTKGDIASFELWKTSSIDEFGNPKDNVIDVVGGWYKYITLRSHVTGFVHDEIITLSGVKMDVHKSGPGGWAYRLEKEHKIALIQGTEENRRLEIVRLICQGIEASDMPCGSMPQPEWELHQYDELLEDFENEGALLTDTHVLYLQQVIDRKRHALDNLREEFREKEDWEFQPAKAGFFDLIHKSIIAEMEYRASTVPGFSKLSEERKKELISGYIGERLKAAAESNLIEDYVYRKEREWKNSK